MPEDRPVDADAVSADAEAIDDALAAFDDACAQLARAAANAAARSDRDRHLSAVRDRLAAVSVPVTPDTADDLLLSAADARAALQRVLSPTSPDGRDEEDEKEAEQTVGDDEDSDDSDEDSDPDEDVDPDAVVADPVLDLAPEEDPPPPPPAGYRASTFLPTRPLPHVLAFEDGRWRRAAVVRAEDGDLRIRTVTTRRGPGRLLADYTPDRVALPHAAG